MPHPCLRDLRPSAHTIGMRSLHEITGSSHAAQVRSSFQVMFFLIDLGAIGAFSIFAVLVLHVTSALLRRYFRLLFRPLLLSCHLSSSVFHLKMPRCVRILRRAVVYETIWSTSKGAHAGCGLLHALLVLHERGSCFVTLDLWQRVVEECRPLIVSCEHALGAFFKNRNSRAMIN